VIRRVAISDLAPTGEGVTRTSEGAGFISGALAGEEVEAEVGQIHKRFWRGRAVAVLRPSPDRLFGPHASGCGGCDWAHFEPSAALRAKRRLFLETMERIGRLDRRLFGELPMAASPSGYRLRNRFHVERRGAHSVIGYFAPATHRVMPVGACEMLTPEMLSLLPRLEQALAGGAAPVAEIATLESLDGSRRLARLTLAPVPAAAREIATLASGLAPLFDGFRVEDAAGRTVAARGREHLTLTVEGRDFSVTPDTFFQGNRHLVGSLYREVRELAAAVSPGSALDVFGGVGFFAGALLDAGHTVVSVEGQAAATAAANRTRGRWNAGERWEIVRAPVASFLLGASSGFDVSVADPPRAGLGLEPSRRLAARTRRLLVYVSCEPATLARDLAALVAEGWRVRSARLYDLFAFTHRIEAVMALNRGEGS
jgi:tRNA/tmRNA/rRNA uracil-C5-methylase (TrmA/RlmC/RlmD family)